MTKPIALWTLFAGLALANQMSLDSRNLSAKSKKHRHTKRNNKQQRLSRRENR